ncbi:DNA-methyltransferase [Asticcacaulis sp. W401b]|uniref:DNA-methyltransferase n=1 Tax=Asticcacaulis sp. W401b TaxID=3388666 RepID=UPI0039709822
MRVQLFHGDCLEVMKNLPDNSVDAIICDPPFGMTELQWDRPIDLESMWSEYWRVLKPNAAVVLFAIPPFSARLICSQVERFKYNWYWHKPKPSGFVHAKNMPLRDIEEICVFSTGKVHDHSRNRMTYNPQGLSDMEPARRKGRKLNGASVFAQRPSHRDYVQTITGYPRQVLNFACETKAEHPTQKPVALMEYLVRTYTAPGDVVLDNTMGSGTTGVAAVNTGRKFIGIEKDRKFYELAKRRIYALPNVEVSDNPHQRGAQTTHFIRASKHEKAIQEAIKSAKRQRLKITKTLIAEMVGLSREQVSKRYGHLFETKKEIAPEDAADQPMAIAAE